MKPKIVVVSIFLVSACKPRVDSTLLDVGTIVQSERLRLVTEISRIHNGRIGPISHADTISRSGHRVVISADDSGKVVVMNTLINAPQFAIQIPNVNKAQVRDTAVDESSRFAAVSFSGYGLYILNLENRSIHAHFAESSGINADKISFIGKYLAVTHKNERVIRLIDINAKSVVIGSEMRSPQGGNSQPYADIISLNYFNMIGAIVDDRIEFWRFDDRTKRTQCYTHIGVISAEREKPIFGAKSCDKAFPISNQVFGHFTALIAKNSGTSSSSGFGGSVPKFTIAAGTNNGLVFVLDDVIAEAGRFKIVHDQNITGFDIPMLEVRKPSPSTTGEYVPPITATTMFAPNKNAFVDSYVRNSGSLRCRNLSAGNDNSSLDPRSDFQEIVSLDFGGFSNADSSDVGDWRDKFAIVVVSKDGSAKILSIGNAEIRMNLDLNKVRFEPGETSYIVKHRQQDFDLGVIHTLVLGQTTLINAAVFVSQADILIGTGSGRHFVWHSNATDRPIAIGAHVPAGTIRYVTVSQDGKLAAAADSNRNLVIWDILAKEKEVKNGLDDVPFGQAPANPSTQRAIANRKSERLVNSIQFSPNGDQVLFADGRTHIWNWKQRPPSSNSSQPVFLLTDDQFDDSANGAKSSFSNGSEDEWGSDETPRQVGFLEANGVLTLPGEGHQIALWNLRGDTILVGTADGQILRFDAQSGEPVGQPFKFSDQPIVTIAPHSDPNCRTCVAVMDARGAIGFGSLEDAQQSVFQILGAQEDNHTVKSTQFRGGVGLHNGLDYYLDGSAFYVAVNFVGGKQNYVAVQTDYLYANNNIRNNSFGTVEQATFAHKNDPIVGLHVFRNKFINDRGNEAASEFLYVASENAIEVWDPLTCQLVRKLDVSKVGRINVTGMTNNDNFLVTGSENGRLDIWHLQNEFKLSDLVSHEGQ